MSAHKVFSDRHLSMIPYHFEVAFSIYFSQHSSFFHQNQLDSFKMHKRIGFYIIFWIQNRAKMIESFYKVYKMFRTFNGLS